MTIYVDGSYSDTYKVASYAFCVVENGEIIDVRKGTKMIKGGNSVVAELLGVVRALKYCKTKGITSVTIVHDYNKIPIFASSCIRTRNGIINDYIRNLVTLKRQLNVSFKKVKAHLNDEFNNMVDKLSRGKLNDYIKNVFPNILKNKLKR
ncbi:hypothetical protein XJ44_08840 [Thermosipho affectus]|uniref:RNase H type-1 domain-containing protein n=1 Tax=Thermosipho affectus TaxID=660294 RepID=A0ABX3IFG4_9BACT|nr:RNase H family protein [Thermosipho affectus]ONN26556.1 hypothetical protein XJ44_08840 [Thermosipho affectus]